MPTQELLSSAQRSQFLTLPDDIRQIVDRFTFTPSDMKLIGQCRGDQNRLGFAIQLCLLRYPGRAWVPNEPIPAPMIEYVARQLGVREESLAGYAQRDPTRREHLLKLMSEFRLRTFGAHEYKELSAWLKPLASNTDNGVSLFGALLNELQKRRILVPNLSVLDRLAAAVRNRARRESYRALSAGLNAEQKSRLDDILNTRPGSRLTHLGWLLLPGGAANPGNILLRIERLNYLKELGIPAEWRERTHQNRLRQIARECVTTDVSKIRGFDNERKYATLVAIVLDIATALTDEILEMHGRIIGREFNKAKRNHLDAFQRSGKAINDMVRLLVALGKTLIEARATATDPYPKIEALMPWDKFRASVNEAEQLARPGDFDYLALVVNGYAYIRRYTAVFLNTFEFQAAPASKSLLEAIHLLRHLNEKKARLVPENAPTGFVPQRWLPYVFKSKEIDRRFYELCVLSLLNNALRSGDLWVAGSHQFRTFEEHLLSRESFAVIKSNGLPFTIETNCPTYIAQRAAQLHEHLKKADQLAKAGALPDATLQNGVLRVKPLRNLVPPDADALVRQTSAMLPRIKITSLLMEVDGWTGFSGHFVHFRNGEPAKDRRMLLTAVLADAINLGINRMAEACPGASPSRLSYIADWHIRDETYSKALAEIVNFHHLQPFSDHWGEGKSSSSDGQRFKAGGRGEMAGQVNARYGNDPSVMFYTHVSDQYAPFHTKIINATVRDATHVLDGLLYHETGLRIEEHYTDTAGFTDHVFAMCHLLGFRFAPRIRDLADRRLATIQKASNYPALGGLIGESLNVREIAAHWDEILRLGASIHHGSVTASLMLSKLGAYPRQNGLAKALREFGRLERTLFTLNYLQDIGLRRRIHIGLNKGEARNALARAVFFNRLGEMRDRSYENQRHRASGLNLVVAAIVLWNTGSEHQTEKIVR